MKSRKPEIVLVLTNKAIAQYSWIDHKIYLSFGLTSTFPQRLVDCALQHELGHYQRKHGIRRLIFILLIVPVTALCSYHTPVLLGAVFLIAVIEHLWLEQEADRYAAGYCGAATVEELLEEFISITKSPATKALLYTRLWLIRRK